MIPHSLIFSFNLAHFGLKQNPTGLQEAIQRSDKNSKTTLIIKSTLERSFLMEKHQKNHFWNIALFTRLNLFIIVALSMIILEDSLVYKVQVCGIQMYLMQLVSIEIKPTMATLQRRVHKYFSEDGIFRFFSI